MTREQLDEIKKLARDPKSATFHDCMARQTTPLIEALEEAWKERDEARAEVERLREVVRQVHALVSTVRATAVLDDIEKLREIHKITKGMVE